MKIIDNRIKQLNKKLHFGDLVITEQNKKYVFVYEDHAENLPCHQVDLETFDAVDSYPLRKFDQFTIGTHLEIGGRIKEIIRNEKLLLEMVD